MRIINTFFPKPQEKLATYRPLGTSPDQPIQASTHEQIDYPLVHAGQQSLVQDCETDTKTWLQSDHYPLIVSFKLKYREKQSKPNRTCNRNNGQCVERKPAAINKYLEVRI